ncbi:MAG: matrixin family metalloprotease [Aquihabitans sp.]
MADPPAEDPFEGWVLDDNFVKGAFRTEHSAEEHVERMQRIDADLRRMPDDGPGQTGRTGSGGGRFRRLRRRVPGWVLIAVLLVIAVVAVEVYQRRSEPSPEVTSASTMPDVLVFDGQVTDWPSVPADVSPVPLGTPPAPPSGSGSHAFLQTQPGSGEPVAYDPCRPVQVVVNDLAAPAGTEGLIAQAVADVAAATGLQFEIEGVTTETLSLPRPLVQKARYGDRWAPVLITWTDPSRVAALEGNTVGVGGSQPVSATGDQLVYVSGLVALDAPDLTEILDRPQGSEVVLSVIAHELGHLVGLDHVDDPGEIMQPEGHPSVTTFGPGDRTGLARLGDGACFPDL